MAAVKAHHFAKGTVATVDDLLPRPPGMTATQVKAALVALAAAGDIQTVHMGRVNSQWRLNRAEEFGCASADGTYLAFGPDINLPRLAGWLDAIDAQHQPTLFGAVAS